MRKVIIDEDMGCNEYCWSSSDNPHNMHEIKKITKYQCDCCDEQYSTKAGCKTHLTVSHKEKNEK